MAADWFTIEYKISCDMQSQLHFSNKYWRNLFWNIYILPILTFANYFRVLCNIARGGPIPLGFGFFFNLCTYVLSKITMNSSIIISPPFLRPWTLHAYLLSEYSSALGIIQNNCTIFFKSDTNLLHHHHKLFCDILSLKS